MPSDKDTYATKASEPLYAWWLNVIPSLLGGLLPKAAAPAAAAPEPAAAQPFPIGQVAQALGLAQQLLGPLFQAYVKALSLNPNPDQAFLAFQSSMYEQLQKLSEKAFQT